MKRTFVSVFLVIIVLTGFAGSVLAGSVWVSLTDRTSQLGPKATVLASNGAETTVKFTVDGFWSSETGENGQIFTRLKFPGYGSTLDIGKPELPVISELIGVPGNSRVQVEVVDFKEEILTGYNVFPLQTPLRETERRVKFDINPVQYSTNSFFPEQMASVSDPAIWRDVRVVTLKVNPVRYNPVTGELKVCTEMTVRLDYSGISDINVKTAPTKPIAPNYARMYRSAVLNYNYLGLEERQSGRFNETTDGGYDYLIIAKDDYVDDLAPFTTWKNTQGLTTQVVPISQVGNKVDDFKAFIADEYFSNGISYLLLVGNEMDIPAEKMLGIFSDYMYTCIEGDDYYADIAAGRFCVNNETHVDNMVNKSVTFESNPPPGEWLEKSLLVANWEEAPEKYQQCKEEIRTADQTPYGSYSVLNPDFTTAYGASFENGGDEASNADVVDYFNEGFRLVNYRGHGNNDIWWYWNVHEEHFGLSDVAAIDNGQMTPVVFSIACYNANLPYLETTLGEAFTQGDDGAVALLGATDESYTDPNHDYDKQLYKCVFDEGINAIGDASNEASVRLLQLWGNYGMLNARMYLWLGDPSLQLIYNSTLPPPPPVLVYPDDGAEFDEPAQLTLDWEDVSGAVSYQVQVDDENSFSAPVLYDVQDIIQSEWLTPELGSGIYYWRVRASDGRIFGGWSEIRSFMVGVPPQEPILYMPVDGSTIKTAMVLLQWYQIEGVTEYLVEVDDNMYFQSPERTAQVDMCPGGLCEWEIYPPLVGGLYYWRVRANQADWPWSETWSFRVRGKNPPITADGPTIPDDIELLPNYPNPFNPTTEVSFGLPRPGHVKIEIFNITGQRHCKLVDAELSAGYHTYTWNGSDAASGIYLCRLSTEDKVITRRMLLLK
ncbi:MAG: T9SS type A sorting domain-containing protein [Candidatus Zixiibacteriota bacterium]|nr:MAG: T9SS type A sorting domain-containing protein [candidate division Zixibacteria bacterium]